MAVPRRPSDKLGASITTKVALSDRVAAIIMPINNQT